jgi:hypothetical protein
MLKAESKRVWPPLTYLAGWVGTVGTQQFVIQGKDTGGAYFTS